MPTKKSIHHPGVQNIPRLAELLQNSAAASITATSPHTLHIIKPGDPGNPHPHRSLSYPHLFHQLLFCFDGSCNLICQNGAVRMEPGSIAACAPLTHYKVEPEPGNHPRLLSIFELGYRWTCFAEKYHSPSSVNTLAMANARCSGTERTDFEQLVGTDGSLHDFSTRCTALERLLKHYRHSLDEETRYRKRNRLHEAGPDERRRMTDAVRLMMQRFPADVSMTELADTCSITPDHFGKLFKKVFGIPPKEWMTHYRVYRSVQLMCGHQSLSRISEQTGFGDQYYFSKAFKQHTGYAPSVYRKQFLRGC